MCFDIDSTPPIPPVYGGAVNHRHLEIEATDGNRYMAFEASTGGAESVIVLPDVRGLFRFYEELALRFAERGTNAVAIDYFGRTAGVDTRPADWDFWPEVEATTLDGITADVTAAIHHLRSQHGADHPIFIVGFCFGGSNAWYMAAAGLGIAGAVGFYGHPDREGFPRGAPTMMSRIPDLSCPVLALQGGDDPGIPTEVSEAFGEALREHGKDGDVVIYRGAPHSFFDRKQAEYVDESADAWRRTTTFISRLVG